jgi:hypothetical protein
MEVAQTVLSRLAKKSCFDLDVVVRGVQAHDRLIGRRPRATRSVTLRPMSKRKVAASKDLTPAQKMLAKLRKQAAARLLKRRRMKSGQ